MDPGAVTTDIEQQQCTPLQEALLPVRPTPLRGARGRRPDDGSKARSNHSAKGGDFTPGSTHSARTGLGHPDGKVESYEDGPSAVGFLTEVTASTLCVGGTLNRVPNRADAFGGYPDHSGCDVPSGGH